MITASATTLLVMPSLLGRDGVRGSNPALVGAGATDG
jgi:hypothetical protein